ncbi:unnamed protein product [Absidia cylindrospora]
MTQQAPMSDALAALLSLPMDFTIDPLVTLHSSSNENLFPPEFELTSLPPDQQHDDFSSLTSSSPSMASLSDSSIGNNSPSSEKKTARNKPVIKKSRLSLEDKDQKTKERILRNRAAAQESRDKKRRYVADLESNNEQLLTENKTMNKRVKLLEDQNQRMSKQLSDFAHQIAELQQQLKTYSSTSSSSSSSSSCLLAHGFCDSARIAKRLFYITAHHL